MDRLTPGQREVIALALLHGWRWEAMYPGDCPLLTNIALDQRGCPVCGKVRDVSNFSRSNPTICLTCYRRKARLAWRKKNPRN